MQLERTHVVQIHTVLLLTLILNLAIHLQMKRLGMNQVCNPQILVPT